MIKADGEKRAAEILTKAAGEIEKSGVTIQLRWAMDNLEFWASFYQREYCN